MSQPVGNGRISKQHGLAFTFLQLNLIFILAINCSILGFKTLDFYNEKLAIEL
jgi:hypothetical protein